ncbi:concanavalin A-like lectin/glucanase domain-containing protein [Lophiotrema nucula]|uniref:Concanavalin A-like lectin/glucanase domain-containing protein n=1 Tax=Lophiotrema nucula TaxID=690887 RepID=A0A6A5Z387_9PLEO|nr:concanavalin A-like lectin/glucanase domain-containing protein [Lophiotrema nucula]
MRSDELLYLVTTISLISVHVAAECTRFSTNGSTAGNYDFYRFYDFRNIQSSSNNIPAVAEPKGQSEVFSAAPWRSGWDARSWFRPASKAQNLDMQYTPTEIFISNSTEPSREFSTYLTLHTTRLANGTQLAAELDYSEHNVTYASIRMLGRVRGASGAVAGFFIYHNDTTESDIEILTKDPSTRVHFSNQPTTEPDNDTPIPGSTFNESLATHQSTSAWNVYRLDWVPGRSAWYLNGAQLANTEVNVPDTATMVIMSLWSNGGNFSGQMNTGDEAWFDVKWVELLFNTTTTPDTRGGGRVCSADSPSGPPIPGVESYASPRPGSRITRACFWWLIGMVSILIVQ